MIRRELYINGNLIELSEGNPIAFTFQVNDIAELADRQASYSNRFTIPATENNKKALYFSNQIASDTNAPYKKLPCYYYENGHPIIQNGVAIIEGYSNLFSVTIYAGIFDFFSQLGDKTLKDIYWGELDHAYDVHTVKVLNEADGPVVWPLIQWGAWEFNDVAVSGRDFDIRYQMPVVKYSYLFQKIFALTNYTYSGNIFNESNYTNLVMTLPGDQLINDDDVLATRKYKAYQTSYYERLRSINFSQGGEMINLLSIYGLSHTNVYDGNLPSDGSFIVGYDINPGQTKNNYLVPNAIPDTRNYVAPPVNFTKYISQGFSTIKIDFGLSHDDWAGTAEDTSISTTGDCIFVVYKNNIEVFTQRLFYTGPTYDEVSVSGIDVKPGDVIHVILKRLAFRPIRWYPTSGSDKTFISITAENSLGLNQLISYNYLIPEIKLSDIIKTVCQMFGLIITTNNIDNVVRFTKFKEIKDNILSSDDWSSKLDLSIPPEINYRFGTYAQRNNLTYKEDEAGNNAGDGQFVIADEVLNYSASLMQLPFSASVSYPKIIKTADQPASGNVGVQIPRFTLRNDEVFSLTKEYSLGDKVMHSGISWNFKSITPTTGVTPDTVPPGSTYWEKTFLQYEQTITSQPRVLLLKPMSAGSGTMNIYDGTNSESIFMFNMRIAYFEDPAIPNGISWNSLLNGYYKELLSTLDKTKAVTVYVKLSENDIYNLNFLRLKYISYYGNLFYLNNIQDYQVGKSCKAQLIRI